MQALPVVLAFKVSEQRLPDFLLGRQSGLMGQLDLEGVEDALHRSIVLAVGRIGQSDRCRVATVPGNLGAAYLLGRAVRVEGRKRQPAHRTTPRSARRLAAFRASVWRRLDNVPKRARQACSASGGAVSGRPASNGGAGAYSSPRWTVCASAGPTDLRQRDQREVDARRDPATGDDGAVAHDPRLLDDGSEQRQQMPPDPVARGTPPRKQTSRAQDERSRAYRGDIACPSPTRRTSPTNERSSAMPETRRPRPPRHRPSKLPQPPPPRQLIRADTARTTGAG